ncbi:uncharacterized protein HMPREF1541_09457 [Cyphellophora europaea CBS 101466]|uniref:Zn(2)-C6 fungal-type domain-containing protein n=1 Tax=Cyphellophora europaea (strain CBS 101466) TaxID=1220924 RepID=W2SAG0_CYPE1|nr:uncharacterized protein HMPREF1541_09457 [Cyphellophora europaea CBS 101466]ETN45625.1 hypothetical protein HMPREF1541_09457 [Cyphellophora europaea CBS 101466]
MEGSIGKSRSILKPCINCRQRKVKCDRGQPCTECVRFNKECLYESTSTQTSSDPSRESQELLARINRLEALLEQQKTASSSSASTSPDNVHVIGISRAIELALKLPLVSVGFLTVKDGLTNYVDSGFWAKLFEESSELRLLLETEANMQTNDVLLGVGDIPISPADVSSYELMPTQEQRTLLLDYFFDKIEPFVGILHEPTFRSNCRLFWLGTMPQTSEFGALLSTVYALTVQILPSDAVTAIFSVPKKETVERFCTAARFGLAVAHVMTTRSLLVFQAFLYWTTFLYERGDVETANGTIGIANQIARRLGLHKDPCKLDISPFISELRARAWNHLLYLNTRAHDFEGLDVSPLLEVSGTFYPVAVHDDEWQDWLHAPLQMYPAISNRRTKFPVLRRQFATLTCFLLQSTTQLDVLRSDEILAAMEEQLQSDYFDRFDHSQVIQRFEALYVRLMVQRTALSVDVTHLKTGRKSGVAFKNVLYQRAVALLALISRAEAAADSFGWGWIFRTNPEFLAVSIVLCHIINRMEHFSREQIDEGWLHIEKFCQRHDSDEFSIRQTSAWRIIQHYRQQARQRIQSDDMAAASNSLSMAWDLTDTTNDPWMSNAFGMDGSGATEQQWH